MRPDFCASNSGRRPPWTRLWTKAEMKTVLPARESPVTPSRSEGENSAAARPDSVSRAILASSVKVVSAVAKKLCPRPFERPDIGNGRCVWNGAADAQWSAGVMEGLEIAVAWRGVLQAAGKGDYRQARCRESRAQRGPARTGSPSAGKRHREILHHRIVADDQHRAAVGVLVDQREVAGCIVAVELVAEEHAARVRLAGDAFQRLAGAHGVGAERDVGHIAAARIAAPVGFGVGAAGRVERPVEVAHSRQCPAGFRVPQQKQPAHRSFLSTALMPRCPDRDLTTRTVRRNMRTNNLIPHGIHAAQFRSRMRRMWRKIWHEPCF